MIKGKRSRIQYVADKISRTPEFIEYKAEFLHNLHNLEIIDTRHHYSKYSDGAISDIILSWGKPPGQIMARLAPSCQDDVYIDFNLNKLIDGDRLINIIEGNRGRDKTCKTESIKEELMDCAGAYFIVYSEFDAIRLAVKKKILDYSVSEEFLLSKSKAYDDHAVEEIKNVLMKFRGVGENVIKRAFKEFVIEDIMTG